MTNATASSATIISDDIFLFLSTSSTLTNLSLVTQFAPQLNEIVAAPNEQTEWIEFDGRRRDGLAHLEGWIIEDAAGVIFRFSSTTVRDLTFSPPIFISLFRVDILTIQATTSDCAIKPSHCRPHDLSKMSSRQIVDPPAGRTRNMAPDVSHRQMKTCYSPRRSWKPPVIIDFPTPMPTPMLPAIVVDTHVAAAKNPQRQAPFVSFQRRTLSPPYHQRLYCVRRQNTRLHP